MLRNSIFVNTDVDSAESANSLTDTNAFFVEPMSVEKSVDEYDTERRQYLAPGLSGLKNLGNTCYMNAALQALCATHLSSYMRCNYFNDRLEHNMTIELMNDIKKKQNPDDAINIRRSSIDKKINNSLTYQLARLFRYMYNKNCIISPKTVKTIVGNINSEFEGYGQNDSQELINCVLDTIHEQTKTEVDVKFDIPDNFKEYFKLRKYCKDILKNNDATDFEKEEASKMYKEYKNKNEDMLVTVDAYLKWKKAISNNHSIITDLFTGMFCSVVECKECNTRSRSYDLFTTISIETSVSGKTNLEQCLKDFSKPELLNGDNQYECEECNKKVDAEKCILIWESPETLIIQLKRFKNEVRQIGNRFTQNVSKTNSVVTFPMSNLELKDNYVELNVNNVQYNLTSIVLHKGSCNYGHYIAYSKNKINNEWYEFNDSTVVHIPTKEIESEIVNKDAYVLIYQKNRS
jgi:ubiquitin C-terminal hydrolase